MGRPESVSSLRFSQAVFLAGKRAAPSIQCRNDYNLWKLTNLFSSPDTTYSAQLESVVKPNADSFNSEALPVPMWRPLSRPPKPVVLTATLPPKLSEPHRLTLRTQYTERSPPNESRISDKGARHQLPA